MAKTSDAFLLSVALGFAPCAWAVQAPAGAVPAAGYDIPAGALDDALKSFMAQSRVQMIYNSALVSRRRSPGLKGRPASRGAALAQLLEGSGLTAVAVNANTYLLQAAPRPRPAPVADAPRKPAPAPKLSAPTELDTIHVTGTRIGRAGFESSLPLTLISNEQIRASGHQTLFDLLRLMPGMAGHHPRNVATEGGATQVPSAAAASASLYSLGPRATLFLVDGRRMANYGLVSTDMGALTDLNGIPLSMVDHIEIAHGGASAIYGADAMAGVVNIILKKDYRGAEVGGSWGVSQRGDAEQQRAYASFGEQTPGGGSIFISADHFTRNPLVGSQRDWSTLDRRGYGQGDSRIHAGYGVGYAFGTFGGLGCDEAQAEPEARCRLDLPRYVSLQPGLTSNAFYTHFRQPLGDNAEFYADVRATRVGMEMRNAPFYAGVRTPADHPDAHPLSPFLTLNYWFSELGPVRNRTVTTTRDYTAGAKGYRGKWEWDLSLSRRTNKVRNRIDGLVDEPAFADQLQTHAFTLDTRKKNAPEVLAAISPQVRMGGEMRLDTVAGTLAGPLFELPGGEVSVAAGFEARREHLENDPGESLSEGKVALAQEAELRDAGRNTSAVYAELNLPLHEKLWLDAAWRLDHSSGYGNQASPMFGVRWQPLRSLVLRASAGEGYRAPTLAELRRPLLTGASALIANNAASGPCLNETGLKGEYCVVSYDSVVNPDLRPETSTSRNLGLIWTPGERFTATVNRYRIRRRNEILVVDGGSRPELYPEALLRDQDGLLYGVQTYLDNFGRTEVRGWEIEAEYRQPTQRWGDFVFRLNGHYMDRLMRRAHPLEREYDYAGYGSPDKSVLGSVRWTWRDWIATLNLRYMGHARVGIDRPGQPCGRLGEQTLRCRTPSATLVGLDLAYGGFDRWLIGLNVANLNDRRPVNYDYNFGGYSLVDDDPVGRYYLISAMYRF